MAALFHQKIWQELARDTTAKAIVVYHVYHTARRFKVEGKGRVTPPNFLGIFFAQHPEASPRTAVALIEGLGKDYGFRFTKRHVQRAPSRPFGVRTAPFRGVATEQGDSLLAAGGGW